MRILCTICSDLLNQVEIYVTKCGHMFHFQCLSKWIVRSESCPQCRSTVTTDTMFRVFPTVLDEADIQKQLDDTLLQLSQANEANKEKDKKLAKASIEATTHKDLLKNYEKKLITKESEVVKLRKYLVSERKELLRLEESNEMCTKKLQSMNSVVHDLDTKRQEEMDRATKASKKYYTLEKDTDVLRAANRRLQEKLMTFERKVLILVRKCNIDENFLENSIMIPVFKTDVIEAVNSYKKQFVFEPQPSTSGLQQSKINNINGQGTDNRVFIFNSKLSPGLQPTQESSGQETEKNPHKDVFVFQSDASSSNPPSTYSRPTFNLSLRKPSNGKLKFS